MSIITQAGLTSLRSLKYGHDTPGGGNSGEPYITQRIPPPFQQQVSSTNIWNSDNGLIRGGFAGSVKASIQDTIRIGKFLTDAPRGPLFIAKQVGLQLSNPRLETKQSSTNNVGAFSGLLNLVGRINNAVGPTRIYNLGINTLAQVPVTAFGGHIVRHGFLPVLADDQKYSNVVVANNADAQGVNNRLVQLKVKLQTYPNSNISHYVSGPGSIDGIGTTTIRRYSTTLNNTPYSSEVAAELYKRPDSNINYYQAQGVSKEYFVTDPTYIEDVNHFKPKINNSDNTLLPNNQINQNVIKYNATGRTYNAIRDTINTQTTQAQIATTYPNITSPGIATGSIEPVTINYMGTAYRNSIKGAKKDLPLGGNKGYNIDQRLGLSGVSTVTSPSHDTINLTPLYLSNAIPGTSVTIDNVTHNIRDLIKFRIEAVDNDAPNQSVWMIFRAYLKDITDDPNPSWSTVNYVGRGEPFYIYKGFERTVSFTFQVAAMSEQELEPMWQKLNYLYSNVMPDYSNGVMRAPYTKLTIGNYLYRQPGIIKSLRYTINNNSPWEISIDDPERKFSGGNPLYELPHVMDVSMTFAPIHSFLPRKFPNAYDGNWNNLPGFVTTRPDDNDNAYLRDIYNINRELPKQTK